MNSKKKKILIKGSSSLSTNAHGAEAHTILSFVEILSKDFEVRVVGPEIYPPSLEPVILSHSYCIINYSVSPQHYFISRRRS